MALQLSAFCTSQVFDSVKAQRQPQWRSKYSLGLSDSPMTKCSPWIGQAFVKRSLSSMNINIIKRSIKLLVSASSMPTLPPPVHIASTLFTLGTALVVPFYTAIILAPHAKWTRKLIESSFPYVVLGIMYAYLLFLSWTPETLPLMFASKYWLPELPGITRMFSSTVTVASAWIHLLAVDLFAGRQIYLDGLQNTIETRHSLVLCLLFCPVGMLSHFFTKAMVKLGRKASNEELPDAAKLYS